MKSSQVEFYLASIGIYNTGEPHYFPPSLYYPGYPKDKDDKDDKDDHISRLTILI